MKQLYFEEALAAGKGVLDVDVEVGHVEIRTHEANTVTVEAEVEEAIVTVFREGHTVHVQAEQERGGNNQGLISRLLSGSFNNRVIITIHVPEECEIRARAITGKLVVSDVNAPVTARVVTGSTRLNNLGGPIYAKTTTGKLSYDGILTDDSHRFEAITGQIRLRLLKEPNAQLEASTTTGALRCDFALADQRERRHLTGRKLRGILGSGTGRIKAKLTTGSLRLEHASL